MSERKKIIRFEDMQVWQDAQDFAVSTYEITKVFPKEERYSLTDQIRRASSSISANIAEGFGRRSHRDTAHFYKIANGSLLETKNFFYLAYRLDYIDENSKNDLINKSENLQNQISAILKYFKHHE
ncbi:four helix bundle protein [soil metagenome]